MDSLVRRSVLRLLLGAPLVVSRYAFAQGRDTLTDSSTAGKWMDEALTTRASDSPLQMQRFKDPVYILLSPIAWQPNKDQKGFPSIVAPRGFVTDLASIPPLFWSVLRPDGDYAYAAIIHDFLYWQQTVPKDTADLIFKMSMEDLQLSRPTVSQLYHAVSTFGNSAWKKNYDDKNKRGEKRILRRFPPDSKTTWEQWKRRGDVFA